MKNLVCFICHLINDDVINRFNVIKDGLPEGFDIVYTIPTKIDKRKLKRLKGINYLYLDLSLEELLHPKNNSLPSNDIVYNLVYSQYNDYDNYWFIEYDIMFNDNKSEYWLNFFNEYKDKDIDLLCCHFNHYNIKHCLGPYNYSKMIYHSLIDEETLLNDGLVTQDNFLLLDNIYFSFLVNCKFSKKMMELIYQYYNIDFPQSKCFFEYLIPTLAMKNNLTVVDFDEKYTQFIDYISGNPHFRLNYGSVSWYKENKTQYDGDKFVHPIKC